MTRFAPWLALLLACLPVTADELRVGKWVKAGITACRELPILPLARRISAAARESVQTLPPEVRPARPAPRSSRSWPRLRR